MNNKVVARFADGRMVKGTTVDFHPSKDVFHVIDAFAPAATTAVEINVHELKAVFFVKDLVGNPQHTGPNEPGLAHPAAGRRIKVVFKDGEVLLGTTTSYQPGRPAFFVEPENANLNEERCYVIAEATTEITLL